MARRAPGAVRAEKRWVRGDARKLSQVTGLGGPALAAVRRLEAGRFWPGALREALDRYERFLRVPGRYLSLPACPCCDPLADRDTVEEFLNALPPRARRELRAVVAPLDAEFERRTLPDPGVANPPWSSGWWHRRLSDP
ncbi:hypothetical protein RM844_17955 [Streptomyces sp. DSM 44915]|uniref:Uncharacterized protein n=1 Tax=Streptomyces chisholmiae TaxID=3075540 RepID=A0ABU2JT53_9ACTN|nr:hypothetical protein [Streptomyces sp. DSM 44915]MDT0268170.1 hypothetical protein [Streptomyces sp. DSM 44915]